MSGLGHKIHSYVVRTTRARARACACVCIGQSHIITLRGV